MFRQGSVSNGEGGYSGDSILNSVGSENQDQGPRTTELSILSPEYRTEYRIQNTSKEKQIWVIRGKEINAKEKNRKRPCLIKRENEN